MIFNFYAQTMPRIFLVDTTYIYVVQSSWQLRLSIFIHIGILVLPSEFVVVAILSEWWSVPITVGTSLSMDVLKSATYD